MNIRADAWWSPRFRPVQGGELLTIYGYHVVCELLHRAWDALRRNR